MSNRYAQIFNSKANKLFIFLSGFFIANAMIAEFIGVKIFSLEKTFGYEPFSINLLGNENLGFNLSAGVLLWPVVFVMTDVINEYFGRRGVKVLSFMAVGLIAYAFVMVFGAIGLPPADFWPQAHILPDLPVTEQEALRSKVGDYNYAFRLVLGQGLWIIIGSLVAFLVAQFIDVITFHRIKKITGERKVWLRATGSTVVSQFIDSFVVLFVAFYIGANWSFTTVMAIGLVNYIYKFTMAVVLTPVIYLAHYVIDRYLGEELAQELKKNALAQ